ncbi:CDP-glucose 4,6-dehydratase [Xanthobacteraceae bacterium Astr-EGSB]|uniref:CDP-glucose 4,6-dehydratase n=1 Tax=Astrobacterium formosum TaxID=3069710 RepID=UPI0027B75282|nr:CDP-glucose 4,6-dehydratase [Xanthobacteraceae bacterium Astr-EGSB]
MEGMVIDSSFWLGRRVFLTGHTGFKGAWTSLLLHRLGAVVTGYALDPAPNDLFSIADVGTALRRHQIADVRDLSGLRKAIDEAQPEVVVHMAAQSLVRASYEDPVGTYATNVMGTVHVLEAVRNSPCVKATVIVTTDKCYENVGWVWGYRENDRLGGFDPYSNSKACAELATQAYRSSFQSDLRGGIASVRAGNVIGGGDWARDRIVPDAMRAFGTKEALHLRNPNAVRPWQHVLDPIAGYLRLAEHLYRDGAKYAEGWNFGPADTSEVSVSELVACLASHWGADARWVVDQGEHVHEAAYLTLDCTKAARRLRWRSRIDLDTALRLTVDWYRAFYSGGDVRATTLGQIDEFLAAA